MHMLLFCVLQISPTKSIEPAGFKLVYDCDDESVLNKSA